MEKPKVAKKYKLRSKSFNYFRIGLSNNWRMREISSN